MEEKIKNKLSGRSSTLMGGYIKAILDDNKLNTNQIEEHFKKFNLNVKKCAYCGSDNANTLDHIFSVVNDSKFTGYDNSIKNLIPCCQMCNSSKGKKTIYEWLDNPTTKGAKRVIRKKGYIERRKKIDNYIKLNKSNIKAIDDDIIELLNKKADEFKKIEKEYLSKLDEILLEDRNYYLKITSKK